MDLFRREPAARAIMDDVMNDMNESPAPEPEEEENARHAAF
jgi:hypothetical protein